MHCAAALQRLQHFNAACSNRTKACVRLWNETSDRRACAMTRVGDFPPAAKGQLPTTGRRRATSHHRVMFHQSTPCNLLNVSTLPLQQRLRHTATQACSRMMKSQCAECPCQFVNGVLAFDPENGLHQLHTAQTSSNRRCASSTLGTKQETYYLDSFRCCKTSLGTSRLQQVGLALQRSSSVEATSQIHSARFGRCSRRAFNSQLPVARSILVPSVRARRPRTTKGCSTRSPCRSSTKIELRRIVTSSRCRQMTHGE